MDEKQLQRIFESGQLKEEEVEKREDTKETYNKSYNEDLNDFINILSRLRFLRNAALIRDSVPTYIGKEGEEWLVSTTGTQKICYFLGGTWQCSDMGLSTGFSSKFRAYLVGSNQTIGTGSWTKVGLNEEDYDVLLEFDKTTNYRFTPQATGWYMFSCGANWGGSVDQKEHLVAVYKDGVEAIRFQVVSSGTGNHKVTGSDIIYLTTSNYIELYVYQNTGGDQLITTGSNNTYLSMHRLS